MHSQKKTYKRQRAFSAVAQGDGKENKMVRIAIDGPGGAGKSSVAKEVAKKLGISRSYVSRLEKKALEELYARFAK